MFPEQSPNFFLVTGAKLLEKAYAEFLIKYETNIISAVRGSNIKDYDNQQDCMQFVRMEVLKCFKNHKKYDDFHAVVKSVIKRRISDFIKKLSASNRLITENRMCPSGDYVYSIENEPMEEPDISHWEGRLEIMMYIVDKDEDFTDDDKEVLCAIRKVVTEEQKYNFDHMIAHYYGYKNVQDYLSEDYTSPPILDEDGTIIKEYESDKERMRKKFITKLNSFKNKIVRGMKRYDYGLY